MTAPNKHPPNPGVTEEAALWFIGLQGTHVPADQQCAFADWLRRSPVHVEEFLRLTALHADLGSLPEIENLDVDQLLVELHQGEGHDNVVALSCDSSSAAAEPPSSRRANIRESATMARTMWPRTRMRGVGYALTAFGLIAVGIWLSIAMYDFLGEKRYITGIGEQRSVRLADGSQVEINARSAVRARVNASVRDLHLQDGEALFHVAKNLAHPFRVHTPQATIEAKGTQFNVDVINDTTVVTLLEGHVLVSSGQASVLLNPGEQVSVARASVPSEPHAVDVKAVAAWTEHRLVFQDARLSDVIAEFNRYSPQPFVIEDTTLRDVRITASFDTGSVQSFVDSLAASGGLQIIRRARGDTLIGRK